MGGSGGYTVTVAKPPWGPRGSLWDIAESVYGDGAEWTRIYDANRQAIGPDPSRVLPGLRLYVPALSSSHGPPGGPPGGAPAPPPMKIDADEIVAKANALDTIADELDGKRSLAAGVLRGLGNFAGNDQEGQAFNNGTSGRPGYVEHGTSAFTDVAAIVAAYRRMAAGLREMAANVDTANYAVVLDLPKVVE